jgi:16S rRNA (cytosine1402-N4)-methyltransferase
MMPAAALRPDRGGAATSAPEPMFAHRPVMLDETLAGLAVRAGGAYVDGTFGRGGHSAAILEMLGDSGVLHALDQDPEACAHAAARFAGRPNFRIHHVNFSALEAVVADAGLRAAIDGVLLDLGVSSPQLDDAARGFSFAKDGPLDMRMNPQAGESAAAWIARARENEIADVLYQFGEERASRRIARRIVEARAEAPITSSLQLAEIIRRAMPGPRQKIHPATRSFQAIRIFVNRELEVLETVLAGAARVLAPGGRLAVISFHSLEDRIVKRFMRDAASDGAPLRLRKVARVFPSEAECEQNPRARSAVLRVAERVS